MHRADFRINCYCKILPVESTSLTVELLVIFHYRHQKRGLEATDHSNSSSHARPISFLGPDVSSWSRIPIIMQERTSEFWFRHQPLLEFKTNEGFSDMFYPAKFLFTLAIISRVPLSKILLLFTCHDKPMVQGVVTDTEVTIFSLKPSNPRKTFWMVPLLFPTCRILFPLTYLLESGVH